MTKPKTIDRCFWIPKGYYHLCNTGATRNTIYRLGDSDERKNNYFQEYTLPRLREKAKKQQKVKMRSMAYGFKEIIEDAKADIIDTNECYVFTEDQVVVMLQFFDNIDVELIEGIYFIRKG